jgi:tetratricopeptide (TPR) repeat protein
MSEPILPSAAGPTHSADAATSSVADSRPTTDDRHAATAAAPVAAAERYLFKEEIARGGMGVIYRATDTVLGREVAVKVLSEKFAVDSGTARRFTTEARITAQLQHPAIPPVHDFGALPDGRPFLAMKLIKGNTLDHLLRQRTDRAADRGRFLAVFEQVCQAVAYAHAHRVIHRDLKPGNVMVGGFGEVQVMDWGVAKVLSGAAIAGSGGDPEATTAATVIRDSDTDEADAGTQTGSILGTLAYMAPEQAAGQIGKVDARSDVFGLGAILAVMLTGRPPYSGSDVETVRVMAIRGDLEACHERLDGCGAEPELVALCRRCLAFGPADRPADAGAVAAEVAALRAAAEERARAAEREQAAAAAQAAEQRRKRRWQLVAAAVVVLALLTGVGGLLLFLRTQAKANAELQAANHREHERFELALDAIKTFHTGVSEDALLKEDQLKGLRERLLRQAAGFYRKLQALLEDQPGPDSQRALAEAYFLLADLSQKLGSLEDAVAGHQQAVALRRQLVASGEPGADLDLARSLLAVSDSLAIRQDAEGSRVSAEEARRLAEASGPSALAQAVLADSHEALWRACFTKNQNEEAVAHAEKALALRQVLADASPSDAALQRKVADTCCRGVAVGLYRLGKFRESVEVTQRGTDIYKKEADKGPADPELDNSWAIAHQNMGSILQELGQWQEAAAEHRKAIDIEQRAIAANPAVTKFRSNQAVFTDSLGLVLSNLGRPAEALEAYQKAATVYQALAGAHPTQARFPYAQAADRNNMGRVQVGMRQFQQALANIDAGLALRQKLLDAYPNQPKASGLLGDSHACRGWAHARAGHPTEAAADLRRALELWAKDNSADRDRRFERSRSLALLAGLGKEAKSGVTAAEAATFADQAVAALHDAMKAGWAQPVEPKEPDFDSLQQRDDFQKLVKELEAKAAANRASHDKQPEPAKK